MSESMPDSRRSSRGRHAASRDAAAQTSNPAPTSAPSSGQAGIVGPSAPTTTAAPDTSGDVPTTTPVVGTVAVPTTGVHGRRAADVPRDDNATSAADAATAAWIADAAEPASAPIGRRASAPTGRRAAAPGGRRAAAPVRPVVVPGAHLALATRAEQPAANRAERRRLRLPRRPASRVAQGAVAVGLALGVGGFAIAPGATDRSAARAPAQADAESDTSIATGGARLTPQVVQERVSAVVLASATAQQAGAVAVDAAASAVSAESVTALNAAVAELDTLIVATQSAQPALSELQSSRPPSPVLPSHALIAAVDPAADASAVAADGAAATSDDVAAGTGAVAPAAPPEATVSAAPTAPTATAPAATEPGAVTAIDAATAQLHATAARVATLTAELQVLTQQQEAAAADAAAAEAARKEAQRASLDAFENGHIPASALCELGFASGQQLRCDAAEALEQLNAAFAADMGTNLVITDSYRSYAEQVACRQQKGSLCAAPGTSNHGNGTAVDLGGSAYSFGTHQHNWMLAHAEEFGWTLPDWARASGSKPEPWHWEFVG